MLSHKDAVRAEQCALDTEHWNLHNCSVTAQFNVYLLFLIYFLLFLIRGVLETEGGLLQLGEICHKSSWDHRWRAKGWLPLFQARGGHLYAARHPTHSSRLLREKVQDAQKQCRGIILVYGRNGFTSNGERSILTRKQALGTTSPFNFSWVLLFISVKVSFQVGLRGKFSVN